jgi:hypothetical protein
VCDDFILQPRGQVTDGVTIAAQTDALARLSFRQRLRGAQERFYVWQEDLPRGCHSFEHSFAIARMLSLHGLPGQSGMKIFPYKPVAKERFHE